MVDTDSTRRWRALAIVLALCVVAGAYFAMARMDRAPTAVEREVEVAVPDTASTDLPPLPVPNGSRDSVAVRDAVDPVPVPPAKGPQVHGTLVLPRQFPGTDGAPPVADGEIAVETVHAWPVRNDGSGEYDDARRESFERVGGVCEDGAWSFDALPPGRWVFVGRSIVAGRRAVGISDEITLVEGRESGPIAIMLEEFLVEGRVSDATGAPIAGLSIISARTTTDWRMESLAPARVRVGDREEVMEEIGHLCLAIAGSEEGAQAMLDAMTDEMIADFADLGLKFEAPDGTDIQEHFAQLGHVLSLWNDRWLPEYRTPGGDGSCVTDEDGRYRIPFDGPGHVQLWAPARARIVSHDGGNWTTERAELDLYPSASFVEQDFVLERTASIKGRMRRSDGGVLGKFFVFVVPIAPPGDGGESDYVKGDRYWFQHLDAGRFSVFARCGGADGRAQTLYTEVVLVPGQALTLDGVFTRSGRMSGIVVDEAGAAAVGVAVVAHAVVRRSVARKGTTDSAGRFAIGGLYPCAYELEVAGQLQREGAPIAIPTNGVTVDAGTIVIDR